MNDLESHSRQDGARRAGRICAGFIPSLALGILFLLGGSSVFAATVSGGKLEFNRDIRPILSENCYACHGPDKGNRKAKLRLDDRDVAIDIGAIKPGEADASELVKRINNTNQDDVMPPPVSHKHLTSAQKTILREWIVQGAKYEPHWAYIKPERPAIPLVKNASWVKNPIDAFVVHDLEAQHLEPSPGADKDTLIRRLSLDLIGLPPTPEEVKVFINDHSPAAYEHLVDRLLASPHYGERMAVPWLDLARFSDTVGYHGDQNQRIFPYRDYVIAAYNKNTPFDQFTIQQLAGDLLPHPTAEDLVATGFNRLNEMTREGGAQAEEYLAKYAADRVRTLATTWLGSTMGCCECHDHKFDPFSTKDFYSMEAFFADVKQWGIYADYAYTPNPELPGFDNEHPFPPEIEVTNAYTLKRYLQSQADEKALLAAFVKTNRNKSAEKSALRTWRKDSLAFLKTQPSGWVTPPPKVQISKSSGMGTNAVFTIQPDQSIIFTGQRPDKTAVELSLSDGWVSALRLELIPTKVHKNDVFRLQGKKEEKLRVNLTAKLKSTNGVEQTVEMFYADADHKRPVYLNGEAVSGLSGGWWVNEKDGALHQSSVWIFKQPLRAKAGDVLTVMFGPNDVGCMRLSVSPFVPKDPLQTNYIAELQTALRSNSRRQADFISESFLRDTGWDKAVLEKLHETDLAIFAGNGGRAYTMVTEAQRPMTIRVLPRGNWQDHNGAIVDPAVPHFLPAVEHPSGPRLTRLDLARWLMSRDNPLTARTQMNRLWKQFFGTGISAVIDDLGTQGEWPVHQELLDWLAVEFEDSGWDVKHMVKTIVMSATYQQTSNPRPEIHEIDPANRLLASQSPRRLDAEFVRDNALAIAGLINLDIGGPSCHPYQPAGYYVNIQFPERDYFSDNNSDQYRRGVYMHWQRTFLQPMLANFDAPGREECTAARNVSNTPQQALTLLNDPTFFEAARVFAAHLLDQKETDSQRLNELYEHALIRPIKPAEEASLEQFLALQREHYRSDEAAAKETLKVGIAPANEAAPELAAWTEVCRVVLNLHETITRY